MIWGLWNGARIIYKRDFIGKKVLVRNQRGKIIADTAVIGFDIGKNILHLASSSMSDDNAEHVTVWIFMDSTIMEFQGKVKRAIVSNIIDISLFYGKMREPRRNVRYDLTIQGVIEGIIFGKKKVMLRKPIPLETVNISKSGLLFRAQTGSLDIGNKVQLNLTVPNDKFVNSYRVVRVQNKTLMTEEYACQIIQVIKNEKARDRKKIEESTD